MSVSIPVWRPLVTNLFYWPANTLAAETDGFKISVVLNTLNKQQRQLDELLDSEKNEDGLIKRPTSLSPPAWTSESERLKI
ncbi:hypothetical protein OH491_27635 (plasmid) [Termitidicoccus mucosus]|uniref:hypothetical protein n=1 Tax=Termitidicoccus mucosus TaxID=1184151 RepID=UPI003183D5F4